MKRIVSEIQSTTHLFSQRLSLRAFLRHVGFSSVILFLLCIFSIEAPFASVSHRGLVVQVQAETRQVRDISAAADIAIVVDNISKIKLHDPMGARFIAAQLFVDQAQPGARIGVVRIPSSDQPSPVKLLDLTSIQTGSNRNTLKRMLTQSSFGPVDPGPTAYFVPALQTASQMLLTAQDNNSKYIIILTDSIAQSGDREPCSSAPDQYHQWFCEIPLLEAHHLSVILFAFTTPGHEAELQPLRHYLEEHGAIVLQVG